MQVIKTKSYLHFAMAKCLLYILALPNCSTMKIGFAISLLCVLISVGLLTTTIIYNVNESNSLSTHDLSYTYAITIILGGLHTYGAVYYFKRDLDVLAVNKLYFFLIGLFYFLLRQSDYGFPVTTHLYIASFLLLITITNYKTLKTERHAQSIEESI
jgi:hypothetical protein